MPKRSAFFHGLLGQALGVEKEVADFANRLSSNPAQSGHTLEEFNLVVDRRVTEGATAEDRAPLKQRGDELKKQAEIVVGEAQRDLRSGDLVLLNFSEHERCYGPLVYSKTAVPPYPIGKNGIRCDDWTEKDTTGRSWYVHLARRGARDYAILVDCPKGEGEQASYRPITVVLHIESAPLALSWSAGFAFSSLRDDRFRLDENPQDSKSLLLTELDHTGAYPASVAVFLHYCEVRNKMEWFCLFNAGLATDLKESLDIMAGTGVRLRSLPLVNSAYLMLGAMYGSHKVLNDDYEGRANPTVPVGSTTASLLANRRNFGFFFGISFGFLGSQEKFTGVYSGKGGTPASETAK